jgi:NAD(P)H-hydrate epimerase
MIDNMTTNMTANMTDNMTAKQSQVVTAAQMRDLEFYTINKMGVPSIVLMERAALACTDRLKHGDFNLSNCVCLCGTGNNGGDGIAIARLLHLNGHTTSIVLVGDIDRLSTDAAQQLAIAQNYGVPLLHYIPGMLCDAQLATHNNIQPTTIVDAIFGIGLSRPVEDLFLSAIKEVNALSHTNCKILSVDIPSGVCTDTGEALGASINASATVTFAFIKRGLTLSVGKIAAGELTVADIGIYDFNCLSS